MALALSSCAILSGLQSQLAGTSRERLSPRTEMPALPPRLGTGHFCPSARISRPGTGRRPLRHKTTKQLRHVVVSSGNNDSQEPSSSSGRDPPTATAPPQDDKTVESKETQEQKPPAPPAPEAPKIQIPPPPSAPFTAQFQSFRVSDLLGPEKVDPDDVRVFREKLCGYQTYFVTGQEPFGEAAEGVLLLGNMRANKEETYRKLSAGLKVLFGEKYALFMVEEPARFDPDMGGSSPSGGEGERRVSLVVVRRETVYAPQVGAWQWVIALVLLGITAGACLELGLATQISKVPPEVIAYFTVESPEGEPPALEVLAPFVRDALPVAYGVLGVQAFHELGHFLVAKSNKVPLGVPFLIPNITIGSFGAITQFRGPCADRSTKFDVSIAGPIAGGTLSLAMFVAGLALTSAATSGQDLATSAGDLNAGIQSLVQGGLVQVPTLLFQGSLLLGLISRSVLGYDALHAATVTIHPLLITGWCGLTVTALNLLPVGMLDGGRAFQAAFGRSATGWASTATYISLGLGLVGGTLSLPFGLYVLLLQRNLEKPALNDVTEVSQWRKGTLAALLVLSLGILLPVFDNIAESAGIGLEAVQSYIPL